MCLLYQWSVLRLNSLLPACCLVSGTKCIFLWSYLLAIAAAWYWCQPVRAAAAAPANAAPNTWLYNSNTTRSTYFWSTEKKNFTEAVAACNLLGAQLVAWWVLRRGAGAGGRLQGSAGTWSDTC